MKTTGGVGQVRWSAAGGFLQTTSPLLASQRGEILSPARVETYWNSNNAPAWFLCPVRARIEFTGEGGAAVSYLADIGESVPVAGTQVRVNLEEHPRVAGLTWRALLGINLETPIPVQAAMVLGDSPPSWVVSQIVSPGVAPAPGTFNAVAPPKARQVRVVPVQNGTFHESAPWALYANSPRGIQALSWAELLRSYAGEWFDLPTGCTGVVGSPTALLAPPTDLDLAVVQWRCFL